MSAEHSRVWFSPHGTEWKAETYEEALEMERDSLVERIDVELALRKAAYVRINDLEKQIETLQRKLVKAEGRL